MPKKKKQKKKIKRTPYYGLEPVSNKKRKEDYSGVIFLAYMHRYGWIIPVLVICFFVGVPITLGVFCFLYSLWSFFGYIFRWKHIYCSYQELCHCKMTPYKIDWSTMRKIDAYGFPIMFMICAIGMFVIAFVPF